MMKKLLTAATLLFLGACGEHPRQPTTEAELIVEARNCDPFDYALWLEWQDPTGTWNQIFLFAVYGDPIVGPTQDFADVTVLPGVQYYILLADADGNLFDTQTVWLAEGTLVDLHFHIIGGLLVAQS